MKKRLFLLAVIFIALIIIVTVSLWQNLARRQMRLPLSLQPSMTKTEQLQKSEEEITIVAKNLDTPWSLAFTPDGDLIFTERPGWVRMIDKKDGLQTLATLNEVSEIGEGGLLGLALHPQYSQNHYLYLYYTFEKEGRTYNRVVRFKKEENKLVDQLVIIDNIPSASNHNGGRIKFGPDGFLYVATGDAANPSLAQNLGSTAGKILRLTDQGQVPPNNPFPNSPVYSYGHRNVQGLAWDEKGRLWATEHGPSAKDELNLIEPATNYGWPIISGGQTRRGMRNPVIQSGDETWAPSGAVYHQGSVLFAGLRGESLFQAKLGDDKVTKLERHFQDKFGRMRDAIIGPDGAIYLATSNRDGRGAPSADDDLILRINPKIIFGN